MEKIWNVIEEVNTDGNVVTTVYSCSSMDAAQRMKNERINVINDEENHFKGFKTNENDDYTIEEGKNDFLINSNFDDYHVYILIEESEIYN